MSGLAEVARLAGCWPSGSGRCTGPPRRVRTARTGRIAWPRPIQTGFLRNPFRHEHGGQFPGRIFGGRRKRSWIWLAVGEESVDAGLNFSVQSDLSTAGFSINANHLYLEELIGL